MCSYTHCFDSDSIDIILFFLNRSRTTKTVALGFAMMGFTGMVRVVSHVQPRNAVLDNTVQNVPVRKTRLASAAATGLVTPLMLEAALPSTPIIVHTSVIRVVS